MGQASKRRANPYLSGFLVALILITGIAVAARMGFSGSSAAKPAGARRSPDAQPAEPVRRGGYLPRKQPDTAGFQEVCNRMPGWKPDATLKQIAEIWRRVGYRNIDIVDGKLGEPGLSDEQKLNLMIVKTILLNYENEPDRASATLDACRLWLSERPELARDNLYTIIYFQGVTALRRGETDNCVMCRGESSCILPISAAAVHTNPTGSRLAIHRFTEYLERFPDDLEVRWLLNIAHMTLGEHPAKVAPEYVLTLDHYLKNEFDIGKFRDIGQLAGVNRFNMAGGAVMEDFDNDGRLDLAVTTFNPVEPMALYRNSGDGTFKDRTEPAGLLEQLGGKNLVQTDFNNDGNLDLFVSRGAWMNYPMRQSLLRNNGDGTFTDVTQQAGLLDPVNSTHSAWADYDNDGWLDVYILNETSTNRLYHNRRDGTFEEVSARAGVAGDPDAMCKGADWIDYDNDDFPDLFVDNYRGDAHLYHNNRNGTFSDVTTSMGIDGPRKGFSCWAWDYDNDGWLDIFATSYDLSLAAVVKGLLGQPHDRLSNRLFHNMKGQGFEDKTKEAGLDMVFETMGCNFGDLDNDGFLDFYLGTGDTDLSSLMPNRMFKNVAGGRFADITASSGTGNLQKGHGVACADWDRDGDLDIFIEMGGATHGDKYHNILFQNPGQGNNWLTVKLVGKKSNRAAIGARIKVVTAGEKPLYVYRHVSAGSSWGGNPLEQHIGLAKAERVATLEIHWPSSGTTQVFHDVPVKGAIKVTELDDKYETLDWKPIPMPK
jgi:FG-GAP-like repeat/ASPIC and UnbV